MLDSGLSVPAQASPDHPWNIPALRSPCFTGREVVLAAVRAKLTASGTAALNGMPGIGKTQVALAYAQQYHSDYVAGLWVSAESRESLISGFVILAQWLNLPEQDAQDQNLTVVAVQRWLTTHDNWLLILDNADNLALVRELLPVGGRGHLLLTTRAQAVGGLTQSVDVPKMTLAEGTLLLLRRAGIIVADMPLEAVPATVQASAEVLAR